MKKIPTLFKRVFDENRIVGIIPEVTEGCEAVLEGKTTATVKWDGACCAIINGKFYKRYDAKKGKKPPEGAIPCQEEPDLITGHFPHWVKCDRNNPADKWFWDAYDTAKEITPKKITLVSWTYEAVGRAFQGNPYNMQCNTLIPHGQNIIRCLDNGLSFEKIRDYLKMHEIEGVVFWFNNEPLCKIKRTDFGFDWKGSGKY